MASKSASATTTPGVSVRVEVRIGTEKPAQFEFAGHEFLVGGAIPCDVRLPGSDVPPLVCLFARTELGVRIRRLAPAFPILLNGNPLTTSDLVDVPSGSTVAVGPADIRITVLSAPSIRPKFVPVSKMVDPADVPTAVITPHPGTPPAEIERMRAELEEQARELEADRVLWYRRRREIEEECRKLQEEADAARIPATPSPPTPSPRELDLDAREQDLERIRGELAVLREELFSRYRVGREELDQRQEILRGAAGELQQRQREFETEMAQRRAEIETEVRLRIEAELRAAEPRLAELRIRRGELEAAHADLTVRRADFALERNQLDEGRAILEADRAALGNREADLARREGELAAGREALSREREAHQANLHQIDRWQASLADRQHHLERRAAEIDARFEQLKRDTLELEEQVRLADADQERITAESDRLEKLRTDLDDRAAKVHDRAAHLESQQAMLAVLRARLDRQAEESRQETARLASDRARLEETRSELTSRLREIEHLKIGLATSREDQEAQQKLLAEQAARIDATLEELRQKQEAIDAEQTRLRAKEDELDGRASEIAEQAAVLKARITQAMDLQSRLEADRTAVRTRETTLSDAETARVAFQEQLRRRAEDLSTRTKHLEEAAGKLEEREADLERQRLELVRDRELAEQGLAATRTELGERSVELARQTAILGEREAALERQISRLQEVGRGVAAARKQLAEERQQLAGTRTDLDQQRSQIASEWEELRRSAPELESRAQAAVDRLASARDMLRTQLAELHEFASQTRADLDAARAAILAESDGLRTREHLLEQARSEHRLALANFRQQLVEWHGKVTDLRQAMARSDARQAEVAAASTHLETTSQELAKQAEELRVERERVAERRAEVERHLADMREWYRKKLRELAAENAHRHAPTADSAQNPPTEGIAGRVGEPDIEDGDRQLGSLLRSLQLVDEETLAALWTEATNRRRTLRQVLLASGTITLYQLALIEAGNLDALMLGRFRVVDRVRVTPHETAYRVYDPTRSGTYLLRVMAESDATDAVLPDEFRQRFLAACDAAHPNLVSTLEVLEIAGRPAVLQEWATGVPGTDWSAAAATPGVWLRLVSEAAAGLESAHASGLPHGRLAPDSFLLTPDGHVKLTGIGEPPWLGGTPESATNLEDLQTLGRIAFAWSQLGASVRKRGAKVKGFPEPLLTVVRRLEPPSPSPSPSDPEPYRHIGELVEDLARLAPAFPCPPAEWQRLLESPTPTDEPIRQSA